MTPSASGTPASQFVTTAIEGAERLGGQDPDAAAEAWEGALRLAEAACDDPSRARIFLGLGTLRLGGPHPSLAGPPFSAALTLLESIHGEDHPALLPALEGLAEASRVTGCMHQAEGLLRRAASISDATHGTDALSTLRLWNALAEVLDARGRPLHALVWIRRLLVGLARRHGPDDPRVAAVHERIASSLLAVQKPEQAAPHAARAAAIRAEASPSPAPRPGADRLLGSEAAAHLMAGRPRTACGAWFWLGRSRHLAGDADGARACWTRAVSTGTDAGVAAPLIGLAILSLDEGRPDDAADALCQATWLLRWWHGRDDPSVADLVRRTEEILREARLTTSSSGPPLVDH